MATDKLHVIPFNDLLRSKRHLASSSSSADMIQFPGSVKVGLGFGPIFETATSKSNSLTLLGKNVDRF